MGLQKAAPEQLRDVEIAGHKLYSVTDERIRAVPKPFFQGVSNKVNGLAQEYARGVLKKVQRLEVGTEAVVNFTKDGKCTGYYVGGQNSMKVKPRRYKCPTTLYITIPAMVYLVQRIYSSLSSVLKCRASALSAMPERCSPVRRCSAIPKECRGLV